MPAMRGIARPASDSVKGPIDLSQTLDLTNPSRYPVHVRGATLATHGILDGGILIADTVAPHRQVNWPLFRRQDMLSARYTARLEEITHQPDPSLTPSTEKALASSIMNYPRIISRRRRVLRKHVDPTEGYIERRFI